MMLKRFCAIRARSNLRFARPLYALAWVYCGLTRADRELG